MAGVWLMMVMTVLLSVSQSHGGPAEDKATVMVVRKLNENYANTIRPPGGRTEVKLQVYFRNIDIDDIKMKANFDITFRMLWNDSRLAYDSLPEARRINYISLLDPTPLWLPDPFFKNAKLTPYKSIHPEHYLRIFPDGNIIYSTRVSVRHSCPMNLKRLPHDTQTCDIKIASYGYTTDDLLLMFAPNKPVVFGQDIHADRFTFEDYHTDTCHSKTSTGEYSCVQVSMKIRRHFGSYLTEWYFPCMCLVVVAWFSFLVSKEQFLSRLLLTLIPLISLVSLGTEYRKTLASVPYVSALDIFTGITMIVLFLSLLYVIVSNTAANRRNAGERAAGSLDEGEVKNVGEEGGFIRRTATRIQQRWEYFSRVTLISAYVFFLFVYFVAYCGTG